MSERTTWEKPNVRVARQFGVDVERAIDAWGDDVYRLALRRTGIKADAEDVLQSVFMKLLDAEERFADERHLKAWILRTAMNCSNDVLRKRGRSAPLDEHDGARDCGLTDSELALHCAIDALPPAQRTAIHLFYFEGYKTEEIAYITGENPSTVRSHLHRARKELRINLKEEGNDEQAY